MSHHGEEGVEPLYVPNDGLCDGEYVQLGDVAVAIFPVDGR